MISDRYTTNMIHQLSKIEDEKEREEYLANWLVDHRWNKMGLPKPTAVFWICLMSVIKN